MCENINELYEDRAMSKFRAMQRRDPAGARALKWLADQMGSRGEICPDDWGDGADCIQTNCEHCWLVAALLAARWDGVE